LIEQKFQNIIRTEGYKKFKKERPELTDEEIIIRLNRFANNYEEVPPNTKKMFDMSFEDFEHLVDALPDKHADELGGGIDTTDVNVAYEDDDVLVFLPDEKQKCINIRKKYAPDRRWCTSWEGSGNLYYNYRLSQNLTLYYVINKSLTTKDLDYASVILVDKYGGFRLADGSNSGKYAGSTELSWNEIVKKIPPIEGKKNVFQPHPLTDEEIEVYQRVRQSSVSKDAVKELGSEHEAELWIELRSPDLSSLTNGTEIYSNLPERLQKKYLSMGLNVNTTMIRNSSPEIVNYLITRRVDAMKNKSLSEINETDIALLNTSAMKKLKGELKEGFQQQIKNNNSLDIKLEYPKDDLSKFVALYGISEFFDSLSDDITKLDVIQNSGESLNLDIPPSIIRFKKLKAIYVVGALRSVAEEVGELPNLLAFGAIDCPNLTELPKSLFKSPRLRVLNLTNCPNLTIPEEYAKEFGLRNGSLLYK
jgi:hypothetical protein